MVLTQVNKVETLTFVHFYCIYLFYFIFYCCSSTVVSMFPPTTLPRLTHPHLPPSILPAFGFVLGSFILVLDDLSPSVPHYTPSLSPLVTVSLVFISMSLHSFLLLSIYS